MSFVVRKRSLGDRDTAEAEAWYDKPAPGLGEGFLDEVGSAFATLRCNALLYAVRFEDVRCLQLV